jgi:hypothetical protein
MSARVVSEILPVVAQILLQFEWMPPISLKALGELAVIIGARSYTFSSKPLIPHFVGDRSAWVYAPASYAERLVAAADALVPLPDTIDDEAAAAVKMQGVSAGHFATQFHSVRPGDIASARPQRLRAWAPAQG